MKALSLKQPYAALVVSGKKTIEIRKWNTKFKGEFFIHASKTLDEDAMKKFGFAGLPTGGIVGKAVLTEVKHYPNYEEHKLDKKKHFASPARGDYGFILEKAQRLPFVSCRGALNFWEFKGKL